MLIVEVENCCWTDACDWQAQAERAVDATLLRTPHTAFTSARAAFEIAIRLTDDGEIQALNQTHRGKDKPTNVLTFPMFDGPEIATLATSPMPEILLGDVVLALGVCAAEAAAKGITLEAHFTHLVAHGMLHLLGYDHLEEGEAEAMEAIERLALSDLGYSDPYGD